jgi:hypothetical protein
MRALSIAHFLGLPAKTKPNATNLKSRAVTRRAEPPSAPRPSDTVRPPKRAARPSPGAPLDFSHLNKVSPAAAEQFRIVASQASSALIAASWANAAQRVTDPLATLPAGASRSAQSWADANKRINR